MNELFVWWLLVEGLGIALLPLATVVFANLPDHGWGLARPLGLLLLGWLVWFPLSLVHALPYSQAWIGDTLLVLVLANVALLARPAIRARLRAFLTRHWGYVLASEVIFAGALALMGWLRSFNPAVVDQEKFMDVAFLSSLWRTPHLPAPDPWLAGQAINYYYFGHFLLATLAKLLGTPPAVAFNVGISLIFALTASAVFAVATNLVALARRARAQSLARCVPFGVVSAVMVLVLGNLNAAQEWWQTALAQVGTAPAGLNSPWAWWTHPALWVQYNWWNPSRVVPNTINEFPAFSFILSDLHAHVLALPFAALALGVAANLLLAQGDGFRAFGVRLNGVLTVGCSALVLGALYAINGWDLPTYLGLAVLALAMQQWLGHGRRWSALFILDLATIAVMLVALAVLLFLPFYVGYTSPAEGFGLVMARGGYSPIGDVFAIIGLPVFIAGSLLLVRLAQWLAPRLAPASRIQWGDREALLADREGSGKFAAGILVGSGAAVLLLWTALTSGFTHWTLLWSLLFLAGCAAVVLRYLRAAETQTERDHTLRVRELSEIYLWSLVGTAAALLAICELVYLRDLFDGGADFRMNTVFKFYYQVWLILGVACGPLLARLLRIARAQTGWLFAATALPARGRLATPPPAVAASLSAAGITSGALALIRGGSPAPQTAPASEFAPSTGSVAGYESSSGTQPVASRHGVAGTFVAPRALAWRWLGAGGTLIWTVVLVILFAAAAVYPVQASASRTVNFSLPRSLDGTAYMANDALNHSDAAAIAWLNDPAHVAGNPVIVEASGGEYTHFDRVSAFTGLPTILGWAGHEWQWRVNWLLTPQHAGELDRRQADINTIYTSANPTVVLATLARYHVRYVYVGQAERTAYPGANLDRFGVYMHIVYHTQDVTIYQVQ